MIEIEQFDSSKTTEVFLSDLKQLLAQAFGNKFSQDDWEHGLGGTHIALRDSGLLVSHAAVVPRRLHIGDEIYSCGYVENVATLPDRQHRGSASMAMRQVNSHISNQFEIGALSTSSKDLYRQLGWEDWQGPSYVLTNDEWLRSKSEDNGIMVLKIDPKSDLNFSSRIACEARHGDSW